MDNVELGEPRTNGKTADALKEGKCWRIKDPDPGHPVDRIRFQDGDYIRVYKDGSVARRNMSKSIYEANIAAGTLVPCEDVNMTPIEIMKNDLDGYARKHGVGNLIRGSLLTCLESHAREKKALVDALEELLNLWDTNEVFQDITPDSAANVRSAPPKRDLKVADIYRLRKILSENKD